MISNYIQQIQDSTYLEILKRKVEFSENNLLEKFFQKNLLPNDDLELLKHINNFKLNWMLKSKVQLNNYWDEEMDLIEGHVNFSNINFVKGIETAWITEEYGLSFEEKDQKIVYPIDILRDEFIVGYFNNSFKTLYYLNLDESTIFKLSSEIHSYFTQGINSYFFRGWQKAIFLNNENDIHRINCYLKQLFLKFKPIKLQS